MQKIATVNNRSSTINGAFHVWNFIIHIRTRDPHVEVRNESHHDTYHTASILAAEVTSTMSDTIRQYAFWTALPFPTAIDGPEHTRFVTCCNTNTRCNTMEEKGE